LAVDRRFKDANGERQTDFINCVAWRQTAEFIGKYFHKGNRIGVCGSIQTRSYDKDGQKVFVTEILVEEAEFVESQSKSESAPAPQAEPTPAVEESGNLPFEI